MPGSVYQTTDAIETTPTTGRRTTFNCGYVSTPSGVLKIVQILLGLLVFICATVSIKEFPVYYGCAVWASVIGFLSMTAATFWLLLHLVNIPANAKNVPWRKIEMAFCALWAVCFLIAGVTLAVVAEAAITRVKLSYFTFQLSDEQQVALNNLLQSFKVNMIPVNSAPSNEYSLHVSSYHNEEYRAATAGTVFSFLSVLVYAANIMLKLKEQKDETTPLNQKTAV